MNATRIELEGSHRTLPPRATILGKIPALRPIHVTVHLNSELDPDGSQLRQHAAGDWPTNSSAWRAHYVKSREHLDARGYRDAFGLTRDQIRQVRSFAATYGLRVIPDVAARTAGASTVNRRTMELVGSARAMSRAFGVRLRRVMDQRGRVFRIQDGPIRIHPSYQALFKNVLGLDARPQASPRMRVQKRLGGSQQLPGTVSFDPTQVAKLYDFPDHLTGKGQTVALIELGGGARGRDLRKYFSSLGLRKPNVRFIHVGQASGAPIGSPDSADGEVMLDIEVVGAVAPDARIVVYFAPNTARGFFRAINTAIHDTRHLPSILSISWGGPEESFSSTDLNSFDVAFQSAATLGISVLVASGDGGITDGVSGSTAHVDFPASSPFATACGGTTLATDSNGQIITSESAWNGGSQGATGGGISAVFAVPGFQSTLALPPSVSPGGMMGRGVPDVAANADPNCGYKIRVDGTDIVSGGTSAAAPLWAGLLARINEALGAPVGYLNPVLYGVAATAAGALRDVVAGNNDSTGIFAGQYAAGAGWDACTGLGTPSGSALLAALRYTSP